MLFQHVHRGKGENWWRVDQHIVELLATSRQNLVKPFGLQQQVARGEFTLADRHNPTGRIAKPGQTFLERNIPEKKISETP